MADPETGEAPSTVLRVPVTKGKGFVEVDTSKIPDAVYAEALLQGLKVLVNRGMSKITKETYPDEAELKTAAMAKAAEQVEAIMAGKVKIAGQKKASGRTGVVNTEAMRLARNLVKDELKRNDIKVSHVEASEITRAAKAFLEAKPELYDMAEENLKARSAVDTGIDIKALIHESPKLVAKANERKAKAKDTLSAKQAGKVAPRQKGKGQPQANA